MMIVSVKQWLVLLSSASWCLRSALADLPAAAPTKQPSASGEAVLEPSALLRVYDVVGLRWQEAEGEKETSILEYFEKHDEEKEEFVVVQSDDMTSFASDNNEFDGPPDIKFVKDAEKQSAEGVLTTLLVNVDGETHKTLMTPEGPMVFATWADESS